VAGSRGGGWGQSRITQLVEDPLPLFAELGVQVLWQCGKLYYDEYKKYDSQQVKVHAFIDHMEWAYALADVIISRAGASSVSELCVVGKPVIFIPSPNVAEDHQRKNAQAIVDKNAALLLKETAIQTQFLSLLDELHQHAQKREELSENFKKLAHPQATQEIIDQIIKIKDKI